MTSPRPAPDRLPALLAAVPGLPPGRTVASAENPGAGPLLWLSDAPAVPGEWARLAGLHGATGLWPLLLEGLEPGDVERPWAVGEFVPAPAPAELPGVEEFLAAEFAAAFEDEGSAPAWPGPAPASAPLVAPGAAAAEFADDLLGHVPGLHLGLVAVERGADVLAALGWLGAVNGDAPPAVLSAVLRSWEDRFALRVVGLGFDTVYAAVAAPPRTADDALLVAAEHLGFCLDAVVQDGSGDLQEYAAGLVDVGGWRFWWD